MDHSEEFARFIEPHMKKVHNHCLYLASCKWDADDLVQDVLIKAYQYYRKVGAFQHPLTLLNKIARNLWIDQLRRRRKTIVSIEAAAKLAYNDLNYAAVRGLVEWISEHLAEREVVMLLLSEVFNYSYQNIAEELQCSVGSVRMSLHRSKVSLRITRTPYNDRFNRKRMSDYQIDCWTQAIMNDEPVKNEQMEA
ncbi:RNA polymerase sigma factor [Paenibacillus sp. PL91]|uniref:RNA polymerase sigma factor n=1 Tax=Paenibacillus sp. PL91 TaxID=2729538 RepID=UPI00145ECAA8|nr:RNA polymerase sigma factor [Paenibacillus sp. PL91]MBC9200802.1 RNA polymerase sigma factor [Paenibacillus sp. PL91]